MKKKKLIKNFKNNIIKINNKININNIIIINGLAIKFYRNNFKYLNHDDIIDLSKFLLEQRKFVLDSKNFSVKEKIIIALKNKLLYLTLTPIVDKYIKNNDIYITIKINDFILEFCSINIVDNILSYKGINVNLSHIECQELYKFILEHNKNLNDIIKNDNDYDDLINDIIGHNYE